MAIRRATLNSGGPPITLTKGINKDRARKRPVEEQGPLRPKSSPDTDPEPGQGEASPPTDGTYHFKRGEITPDVVAPSPRKLRDRIIVRQVLAGDRNRFSLLVCRYRERIFALTRRMVNDRADAEDLTQLTFTEAFEGLARFDQQRKFRTWLFRIATNNCLDFLKNHQRREYPTGESGEYETGMFTGRVENPEQWLRTTRRLSRALIALEQLKPKYRIPVVLKDLEGLSYQEMQEVLDLPVGTLRIRVHRGRQQIKEMLDRLEGK